MSALGHNRFSWLDVMCNWSGTLLTLAASHFRNCCVIFGATVLLGIAAGSGRAQEAPPALDFAELDRDGNQHVSSAELFARQEPTSVQRRDFQLADFDGSGELSLGEFRGMLDGTQRQGVPDPLEDLLSIAMEALDESCGDWSKQPDLQIPAPLLLNGFLTSFSPSKSSVYDPKLLPTLDPNGDQKVSREEAHRFLKVQLGLLDPTGRAFRDSTGWLISTRDFADQDANGDGQLDKAEYEELIKSVGPKTNFDKVDRDDNQLVALDEFALAGLARKFDVVEWFRAADTDLNALLSREELLAVSAGRNRFLTSLSFRSFDTSNDHQLSLQEYLLTPHCSGQQWKFDSIDRNYDHSLSFAEFRMQPFDPLILRSFYFSRLDRNGDGKLTRNEFSFPSAPVVLERFTFEGAKQQIILQDAEYAHIDRLAASESTQRLAMQVLTVDELEPAIVVMNLDGTNRVRLCSGECPTWSPDGRQICFSRSFDADAIQILDLETQKEQHIGNGSSPAWSPDGTWIVYLKENRLTLYSSATGETKTLPHVVPGSTSWGEQLVWHPDSKHVVLKEASKTQWALALLSIDEDPPTKTRLVTNTYNLSDDIDWAPDGTHFVFPMYSPELRRNSMFRFEPGNTAKPVPVEGYSSSSPIVSSCYAPDGKSLLLAVEEKDPNITVLEPVRAPNAK